MFEIRKSIKRFREDPAWIYERRSRAPYTQFDERAYPFSLASRSMHGNNFLSGVVSGYEVTLFHLTLNSSSNGNGAGSPYSVAALEMPWILPATLVAEARLLEQFARRPEKTPLPFGPWRDHPVLPVGHDGDLQCVGDDFEFSRLVLTDEVGRLTREAQLGWRIDGNRLIGWISRHRPYEDIITLAERLAMIVAAFPRAVWTWPTAR